ncbi:hypothetical protein ACFQX7_28215 [Luedemannella flava]
MSLYASSTATIVPLAVRSFVPLAVRSFHQSRRNPSAYPPVQNPYG